MHAFWVHPRRPRCRCSVYAPGSGAVDRSVTASGNIDRFLFLDRDDDAGVLRVRPGEWVLKRT